MKPELLRTSIFRKPFRPVRVTLQSGDSFVLRHPENIIVTDHVFVAAHLPDPPLMITEPEYVVSVEPVRSGGRGKQARKQ